MREKLHKQRGRTKQFFINAIFLFNMEMKLLMKQTNRKILMHWSLDGQKLMVILNASMKIDKSLLMM